MHPSPSAQDPQGDVHLLLDVCLGGELYSLLRMVKCMEYRAAAFYTSCTTCSLLHLHQQSIAYRDLKPENIVIAADGYPK